MSSFSQSWWRIADPLGLCIVLFAASAGALGGCAASGPDFARPEVPAPADWSLAHAGSADLAAPPGSSAPPAPRRWALFADPELTRLQALAAEANQDLKTAALRVLQARVDEATVSAQRGPQVQARGGAARQRPSENGSSARIVNLIGGANKQGLLDALSSPFTLYQAGFDASWEPDLWGRVLRSEEAAQANTAGERAALRQMQSSVAAELARSYFSLRAAQRRQRLLRTELADAEESVRLLDALFRGGLSDETALSRQRAQRAALQADWPLAQSQEASALSQITLLCGMSPGSLNAELMDLDAEDARGPLPDLALGLPSELARRRPDIDAAEARLHAATADIGVAVADLYPRITLGASFGLETAASGKFGDWGSRQWSVGPSLSLPVFDQGRRRATIVLRELQAQEAAVAYQQVVSKAFHEVDDAVAAYVAEVRRGERIGERLRLAENDAALAQAGFAHGLSNYLPVLSARSAVSDMARERSDSVARAQTALVAVFKSLGDDGGL